MVKVDLNTISAGLFAYFPKEMGMENYPFCLALFVLVTMPLCVPL